MGILALALASAMAVNPDPQYQAQMDKFRAQREAALRAEDGWLSVAGLSWLKQGANRVGSAPGSDVELPAGAAPAHAGVLTLRGEAATFEPATSASVTLNGEPLRARATLQPDGRGQQASTLGIGRFKLLLIKRGERYAIRLRDNESELRRNFAGCRWFPVRTEFRFDARFEPNPGGAKITFETVAGNRESYESAGFAVFDKDGKTWRLEAARSGQRLWFVFRDGTSGKTTYAGARQLYTDLPANGRLVLDFNQAINLPCAFNPYTTCPIPPPQNRLTLAIEAGEMDYQPR
jgi:uncharacterized protein